MATNPTLLTMPIAENGQKNTIPATQAEAGDGLLSQSTGFPPETALPLGAGGKAPTREDFNGALNLLSNIAFYAQKGWFFQFDDTQAYFAGCVVRDTTDGVLYEAINDVAAGGDVPSSDSDNWKKFFPVGKTIGEIFPYAGTTQPPGALLCNGSAVSRTMYPDLFDEIGTKYGAGDGSNTFNLPNLLDAALMNGAYTKTKYETAGSATFTASKTGWYRIVVKGGGGGGQGANFVSPNYYEGGGAGGEGGTTIAYEKMTVGDTASVVIGAGGAGGAAGGLAGTNGGNSTVTINLHTYTGGGGEGGVTAGASGGSGTIQGASGGGYTVVTGISAVGSVGAGAGGSNPSVSAQPAPAVNGGGGAGGSRTSASYAGGTGGDGYAWIEYIGASEPYFIQAFNASTDPALVDLTQIVQDLANKLTREQTPAFNKRDVITTSGTYTAPVDGWYKITVKGGGGGGGGGLVVGTNAYCGGAGGGEGGLSVGYKKMAVGDTASVVVGAGGAGGAAGGGNGSDGGGSSVVVDSTTISCGGGKGATEFSGAGGTGDVNGDAGGSRGYSTTTSAFATGGAGGGTGGGKGGGIIGTQGGGGGGGHTRYSSNTMSPIAGGNGGDGYATFEYFDPSLM